MKSYRMLGGCLKILLDKNTKVFNQFENFVLRIHSRDVQYTLHCTALFYPPISMSSNPLEELIRRFN